MTCRVPYVFRLYPDIKTKAAVDFARKMARTRLPITKQDVDRLREYFSDHEIAELCAFIAFGTGYARFGASLNVDVIKS